MAPNPRVAKAFRAMRELGIPEEKTKPVLKNLLKLYEKNWELIEEENYRALADAIFDSEEAEAAEQKKKRDNAESEAAEQKKKLEQAELMKVIEEETQIPEEPERPLKRLRLRHQDGQAPQSCTSSSPNSRGTPLIKPKLEIDELPDAQPRSWSQVKTQPSVTNESGSDSAIRPRHLRDKGKEPLSPQTDPREKKSSSDRPSHGVRFKEPKPKQLPKQSTPALIKPKDEPVTDDISPLEVPLAVIMPADAGSKGMPSNANGSVSNEVEDGVCLPQIPEPHPPCKAVDDALEPVMENTGANCEKDTHIEQNGFEDIESQSLVAESNNQLTANDIRSLHDVNDIAKGQESVIISLVNEVNNECPPSFHYIPQNAVFQNAYVNFSLARIGDDNCCSTCFGDCLTSSTACACALQSGGEFAYTIEGLVKEELLDECVKMNRDPQKHCLFYCKECPLERSKNEEIIEPCKGHSVRSFIKECWLKCGCNKQCGNRVVQRGINRKLQVFMTPGGKGWGLRTLEDLPKGAFVCEYVGEVLTNAELYDRVSRSLNKDEHAYPVLLDADWGAESELKDEEALCLDATYYGNVARFINHRCFDSNLVEIPVEVENPDHHYYHLAFFTTKKVKALEELTWDYGIDFDDEEHPVKAFQCRCGSRYCRNIKRPNRPRKRRYT